MKKTITALLLLLVSVMSSYSQVQNKFFGATFGVSDVYDTFSCMNEYFGEEPTYIIGVVTIGDKIFAGYKWDAINAYFHNGKFYQVNLRYHGNWKASSKAVLSIYKSLEEALELKYGDKLKKTILPDEYGEMGISYFDGRYAVSLYMRYEINEKKEKEYGEVGLWYWDEKIRREPVRPIINNDL